MATEAQKYIISFRPSLKVEDFASFSHSLITALEQSLPCANIKLRIHEIATDPSVKATVAARLTLSSCQGLHGLCRHAEPLTQIACDNLLVREISAVHSGPFRRLFEAAGVVPASSPLHASLASKIQRTWRKSPEISDTNSPTVPLHPYPSSLRRDEAAQTVQRAWRKFPEDESIDLKLAMRHFRTSGMPSAAWGLHRELRARFDATLKSGNVLLSFDRREAEICPDFRSGRVWLEQESRAFDFELVHCPTAENFRVGFGSVISAEIPAEELRVGRVFQVRLVEAAGFFCLGVFSQGRLTCSPARTLGDLAEIFCRGSVEFNGKIRLAADVAHPMTVADMTAQIEKANSVFFARPENPDSVADAISKISSLMQDVDANARRIQALALFEPEDRGQVLHDQPVKRNSFSIPRLGITKLVSVVPDRVSVSPEAVGVSSEAESLPPPLPAKRALSGRYKEALESLGPAERSRPAVDQRRSVGASVFTEASVFSGSEELTPRSRRSLRPREAVAKSIRTQPVAPERQVRGPVKQQAVKKKVSNKKEALQMKHRPEDEESSGWSDLFASDSERLDSRRGSQTISESSGWF